MQYCGLDVASKESYYYITDKAGNKIASGTVITDKDGFRTKLKRHIDKGMRIAVEAGNQTIWIYEYLCELGAEVTVVNAGKVKAIANAKRKTDKVDAKLLCKLLRIDELPGGQAAAWQAQAVRQCPHQRLQGKLQQEGRAGLRLEGSQLKVRKWKRSHIEVIIGSYYTSYCSVAESIKVIDKALKYRRDGDKREELLETLPMVGKTASQTLLSAVDKIERFSSSKKLVSYSGLAPTVRSSGDRTEYGSITREGRKEIRWVWGQIAQLVANSKKPEAEPLRVWFEKISKRRGKRTAIVALTRKLLTIAYCMLRDEMSYDPSKLKLVAVSK
jgi:transposase